MNDIEISLYNYHHLLYDDMISIIFMVGIIYGIVILIWRIFFGIIRKDVLSICWIITCILYLLIEIINGYVTVMLLVSLIFILVVTLSIVAVITHGNGHVMEYVNAIAISFSVWLFIGIPFIWGYTRVTGELTANDIKILDMAYQL